MKLYRCVFRLPGLRVFSVPLVEILLDHRDNETLVEGLKMSKLSRDDKRELLKVTREGFRQVKKSTSLNHNIKRSMDEIIALRILHKKFLGFV